MSHAHAANFVHCVFSTKDRRDLIPKALEEKLWAYLFGIAKNLEVKLLAVGGTCNHIHLLICLPPSLPLAEVIQKLKANSSRWLGEHGLSFEWQKRIRRVQCESISGRYSQSLYSQTSRTSHETKF